MASLSVVLWSDDSYSPVDINTRSAVPEHPEVLWKVSDILTNPTSGMEIHNIIDWTGIVDFSFEWYLDFKTQHYTEYNKSQFQLCTVCVHDCNG